MLSFSAASSALLPGELRKASGNESNIHLVEIRHSLFGSCVIKYSAAKCASHPHLPRHRFPFLRLILCCHSSEKATVNFLKKHCVRVKVARMSQC